MFQALIWIAIFPAHGARGSDQQHGCRVPHCPSGKLILVESQIIKVTPVDWLIGWLVDTITIRVCTWFWTRDESNNGVFAAAQDWSRGETLLQNWSWDETLLLCYKIVCEMKVCCFEVKLCCFVTKLIWRWNFVTHLKWMYTCLFVIFHLLKKKLSIFKQAYVAIHSFGNLVIHPSPYSHVVSKLSKLLCSPHKIYLWKSVSYFSSSYLDAAWWLLQVKGDMISWKTFYNRKQAFRHTSKVTISLKAVLRLCGV